jgi:hypothetical protein
MSIRRPVHELTCGGVSGASHAVPCRAQGGCPRVTTPNEHHFLATSHRLSNLRQWRVCGVARNEHARVQLHKVIIVHVHACMRAHKHPDDSLSLCVFEAPNGCAISLLKNAVTLHTDHSCIALSATPRISGACKGSGHEADALRAWWHLVIVLLRLCMHCVPCM